MIVCQFTISHPMHVANIWGDGEKNYHQPLTEIPGTEIPRPETFGSET